jgi:hypothetical protein
MQRIGERREAGVGPRRPLIEIAGDAHVQRLVWPLVIELGQERIEPGLLLQGVARRRLRRFPLEREMHPLVTPVRLGMPGRIVSDPSPAELGYPLRVREFRTARLPDVCGLVIVDLGFAAAVLGHLRVREVP